MGWNQRNSEVVEMVMVPQPLVLVVAEPGPLIFKAQHELEMS